MKKTIRILMPIILAFAILLCLAWYLFVYDREFTRDMLLSCARYSENQGNHTMAAWFYSRAYAQANDNDAVAIELAEQYKAVGNYTKAEYTLRNAIEDGGGVDLYIALCKTYVEQNKLWDAVSMLNNITNEKIKEQLNELRPAAPTATPEPGLYKQYISVAFECESGTLYTTTNGTYPSVYDTPYTEPISLTSGENTIYAICVSESGLVSPLCVFGYAVGGVIETVEFSDAAMEAAIRETLGVSNDKEITTEDLWSITAFTVPAEAKVYSELAHMTYLESLTVENGVSDQLRVISSLTGLTQLRIADTSVSQEVLTAIAALPKLEDLTLNNCGLSVITPLSSAKGLIKLDLSENTIRTIDAITSMQSLQQLNLQHNAVIDLSALSSLMKLEKLDVSYNSLTSITPVCSITALSWLDASRNTINALDDMSRLTSLSYLSLSNNALTGLSNLSACSGLIELYIASNALTDISELSALTGLMYLDFSYNQVVSLPTWSANSSLVSIDGSHNLIQSIDSLSGLKLLNNVFMDYNAELASVDKLVDCPMLIQVNVYGTKVKDVRMLTHTEDGLERGIIVNYDPT